MIPSIRHSSLIVFFTGLAGCGLLPVAEPKPTLKIDPNAPVEQRVQFWLARIDENPYLKGHVNTPAMDKLVAIGEPTLGQTLPLLLSENPVTRMHARRTISQILCSLHGDKGFLEFWDSLGGPKEYWKAG